VGELDRGYSISANSVAAVELEEAGTGSEDQTFGSPKKTQ
jgi:hypothetical protein